MEEAKYILSVIPGRKIVKSVASGVWKVQDVQRVIDDILKAAGKFGPGKWCFMTDISKMAPIVDSETSNAFAQMHVTLESKKCAAIAFVVGGAIAIKAQAQRHQDVSDAKLVVGHFRTEDEALAWIKGMGI